MQVLGTTASQFSFPIVTGGTLYSDATYYYRAFKNAGIDNLSVRKFNLEYTYYIIGGGGATGLSATRSVSTYFGGAGGAGGYVTGSGTLSVGDYAVFAGRGARSNTPETTGESSYLGSIVALGGGCGGNASSASGNPGVSGSSGGGGGSGLAPGAGGAGTSGQGNAGGPGSSGSAATGYVGGGGGGAGSAGGIGSNNTGGSGITLSFGTTIGMASNTFAVGGTSTSVASAGTANTGNGASGGSQTITRIAGGSGIVVVRYLKSAVGG